jgi:hypothetical protein
MLKGLGRADLMAGEAAHAVLGMDRNREAVPELVDMHRAVLHAETAAVARIIVDPDLDHRTEPSRGTQNIRRTKLNTYILQEPLENGNRQA